MKKAVSLLFLFVCLVVTGQDSYRNMGLYPNSVQVTFNPRNTAIGITCGRLIKNGFGLYAGFSNTISPNPNWNNYDWERKFSLGATAKLFTALHSPFHISVAAGAVRNFHGRINSRYHLLPGQTEGGLKTITNWGCDLGFNLQRRHLVWSILYDPLNDYAQLGVGIAFKYFKI